MPSDPFPLDDSDAYGIVNDAGQVIVFDPSTGIVLAAADEDGTDLELEPGLFEVDLSAPSGIAEPGADEEDEYEDERADELDERLGRLEQRVSQPQILVAGDPVEYDPERIAAAMEAQGEQLEAGLGRPLTLSERRALGTEALERVRLGDPLNMQDAADVLAWRGEQGVQFDLDSDTSRQEFMATRLQDAERRSRADAYRDDDLGSELEPVRQDAYDVNDDQERVAGMVARLEGREGIGFYDSSEFEVTDGDET